MSNVVYKFTRLRVANMSYIGMTSREFATGAQEHLHSTINKTAITNIVIRAHLVIAVTLALVSLRCFDNAITNMKLKFKKHY